jgi:hypothetical protein
MDNWCQVDLWMDNWCQVDLWCPFHWVGSPWEVRLDLNEPRREDAPRDQTQGGDEMMYTFRFTIFRWMVGTAAIGLNIAWVRAYLLAEMSGDAELFDFAFLIFFALQLGMWRYLSTARRRCRFWLSFVAFGLAATVALTILFGSDIDLINWYTGAASDLAYLCLPARVDAILSHEHWDWFLAIAFFLPELFAAALGDLLAARLFKVSMEKVGTIRPATPFQASSAKGHQAARRQIG